MQILHEVFACAAKMGEESVVTLVDAPGTVPIPEAAEEVRQAYR
jgi:hypothetical protein